MKNSNYAMSARQGSRENDWCDQSDNSKSPRSNDDEVQQLHYKKSSLTNNQQQAWAIDDIANVLSDMNMPTMNNESANFNQAMSNYHQSNSDLQDSKSEQKESSSRMSQQQASVSENWSYGNSMIAPSLRADSNVAGLQPEHSIQPDAAKTSRYFRYVLGAPTAIGSKHGYGSLTYLNQSQSYEIRLKRVGDFDSQFGSMVRSNIRLSFIDRRLQFREKDEVGHWQSLHPRDRMLDLDLTLSYGIFEVNLDQKQTNWIEFTWDTLREASVFVRLACLSTEFTSKRHGGERGVPLKLMVETKTHTPICRESRLLDTAYCQIKVFKSKGADRKHKTDREKFDKNSDNTKALFQPAYDCTLFVELHPDTEPLCDDHLDDAHATDTYSGSSASPRGSEASPASPTKIDSSGASPPQGVVSSFNASPGLPDDDSSEELCSWLNHMRFDKLAPLFCDYKFSDLKQLSKNDIVQICGPQDGIRLFNVIHKTESKPQLTIYVTADDSGLYDLVNALSEEHRSRQIVYTPVYMDNLTTDNLISKISDVVMVPASEVQDCFIYGPGGI